MSSTRLIYLLLKMKKDSASRFILLPATQTEAGSGASSNVQNFLLQLESHLKTSRHVAPAASGVSVALGVRNAPGVSSTPMQLKVLDSIQENGAKLVEIKENELANFRFSYPGLRIIPEKFYERMVRPFEIVLLKPQRAAVAIEATVVVVDAESHPISNAYVVAFTDFAARAGNGGNTNTKGEVKLKLTSANIERLYVYPEHSFWGYFQSNFVIPNRFRIELSPIDVNYTDVLRHFYDAPSWPAVQSTIKVAVVDTGVGPHADLIVAGGANTIEGENPTDYADNGEGHGTHVAGIIAANGALKGVAAGVEIYSYRVFPKQGNASNFYIMKAIQRAIADGCDLINLSLGSSEMDEGLVSYIKDAYSHGVLCFAANGNDDRNPVSFPAAYSLCVAVSAMGRKGTFPAKTIQQAIVKAPYGKDAKDFIADFSNVGPETDITAPGVGIISTFPDSRVPGTPSKLYAVMDGTSMACPAATGLAARLLTTQPQLLSLPRNQHRADEMLKFLARHIQTMGFEAIFEGKGMLLTTP